MAERVVAQSEHRAEVVSGLGEFRWPLGRNTKVHFGEDGKVRMVDVQSEKVS